jgi:hypothetical protein
MYICWPFHSTYCEKISLLMRFHFWSVFFPWCKFCCHSLSFLSKLPTRDFTILKMYAWILKFLCKSIANCHEKCGICHNGHNCRTSLVMISFSHLWLDSARHCVSLWSQIWSLWEMLCGEQSCQGFVFTLKTRLLFFLCLFFTFCDVRRTSQVFLWSSNWRHRSPKAWILRLWCWGVLDPPISVGYL